MKTIQALFGAHLESFSGNTSTNFENQIFRRQSDYFGEGINVFRLEHDLKKLEILLYNFINKSNPSISSFEDFEGMITNKKVRQRAAISGIKTKELNYM